MSSRRVFGLSLAAVAIAAGLGWTRGCAAQDGKLQMAELGACKLDSGQVIEHCRIGYRTYGKLDAAGDNAVLFPTWYNGRTEDLAVFFGPAEKPGVLVDSGRWFGVSIDALADGVSSSPSSIETSNGETQYGAKFPVITIRDMVRAEYRLATEVLHLKHAHAVIGISMGGMQTFEWAATYPEYFDLAIPIVGSPQQTSYDLLNWQTLADAIEADPAYAGGTYTAEPPLKLANELGALTLTSPMYRVEQTTRAQYEGFLEDARKPQRQDANDRMWQLKAMMTHDVLRGRTIDEAAKAAKAKFLVAGAQEDHLVNPVPELEWAKAVGAPTFLNRGSCGHLIFNCDGGKLAKMVQDFLAGKTVVSAVN